MNPHELRARIKSVNSTKKIIKTQEPIATLRTIRTQRRVAGSQPYADEIEKVIGRLASASSSDHPMPVKCEGSQRVAALVVTSGRDTRGDYDHNVLKEVTKLRTALEEQGHEVVLCVTGHKGTNYYDFRDIELADTWEGFSQDPDYTAARDVRCHLIDGFSATAGDTVKHREGLRGTNGEAVQGFDRVRVVYTEFVSVPSQIPRIHQMFPTKPVHEDIRTAQGKDTLSDRSDSLKPDYEFEPDTDTLLAEFLPQYVSHTLLVVMLEAAASESAACRSAMKSATDDATELVKDLPRTANRARQTQVTQEVTEVIGGTGALDDNGESDQM